MKTVLTAIFICLLMSSKTLVAGEPVQATNFLEQTPSSEQLVEALKSPPQLKFRSITVKPIQSKVLLNIKFELNSDELTQEAIQTLSELGKAMEYNELKNTGFIIEGHTDAKGTGEYNQKLSQMRALSVYNYLTNQYEVDSSQLKPVGKGETELFDAINPESPDNRRVEVINLGRKIR